MSLAQLNEQTPAWVNWIIIAGGALVGWLSYIASFVAIVWGCMQIYGWIVNRGWRRKGR